MHFSSTISASKFTGDQDQAIIEVYIKEGTCMLWKPVVGYTWVYL